MLSTNDLCRTLQERAKWTDRSIKHGLSTRLGLMEETITDINLLEVAMQHEDYVFTKKFSRRQEGSVSGADWLWCIGEPGAWLLLLVQAKIISPKTGKCNYLNYRRGSQRSLLLKYARKIRAMPIYVVYAHIPTGYEPPPKASPHFSRMDANDWGCSWVTPRSVKKLVLAKSYKLEDVLRHGIPWASPFCAEPTSDAPLGLAAQVARGFQGTRAKLTDRHLVPQLVEKTETSTERKKHRTEWDEVDPNQLIQESFPNVVTRLLNQAQQSRPAIGGISVVSAVPLRELEERKLLVHETESNSLYVPTSIYQELNIRNKANK